VRTPYSVARNRCCAPVERGYPRFL
jgi:hypothetical protein